MLKWLKKALQGRFGHSNTGVFDGDDHELSVCRGEFKGESHDSGMCELQSVVYQIEENLPKAHGVCLNQSGEKTSDGDAQRHLLFVEARTKEIIDISDDLVDLTGLFLDFYPVG